MRQHVQEATSHLIEKLRGMQSNDGSWRFCFEGGPLTDAYMIILLRTLEQDDEWLIQQLVTRILSIQQPNGSWKLFHDEEEGNLSATVEAYYGLLFSHYMDPDSAEMQQAKQYIIEHGGLTKTNSLTKALLAVTGHIPWPKHLQLPIEGFLLPRTSPIHFYQLVGYTRVHLTPVLISSNLNFSYKTSHTPDLSELINTRLPIDLKFHTGDEKLILNTLFEQIGPLLMKPKESRQLALKKAERFMLERIEPDGLLYNYFGATFFMIFALLSLGYKKNHPFIQNALHGLRNQLCLTNDFHHIEYCPSTVWDTALLSHGLQQAGVPETDPLIQNAMTYLLSRQHLEFADWALNNPDTLPGGWGFSDFNTLEPDVDDTTVSLRAIRATVSHHPALRNSWNRGLNWVLSMQNDDGGWSAFEKNLDHPLIAQLPFKDAYRVLLDPSTADLTGRTLEFLGNDANLRLPHAAIEKATQWLVRNQEENGSWYGRWGICYIYGTWAAITGLLASGTEPSSAPVRKGVNWLLSVQNTDGGWGESCYSDIQKRYVPLGASTPSQTAWALDALITAHDQPTNEINKGMTYLIQSFTQSDWTTKYPTGGGIPEVFYIHYHSYKYIWPLLTMSHYFRKY
ncbi:prenyltransferase/squalene oxidase repeat-containing protein [Alkalihalobacterium sp. APHAB7]|uniref:terpene cyclase/mutase family protein n=1 Tax=Alkalihalobacterium sp. APHAB7 TaxID=3402081 RepID=UPI003AAF8450